MTIHTIATSISNSDWAADGPAHQRRAPPALIDQAHDQIDAERGNVENRIDAFDRFITRVEALPTESPGPASQPAVATVPQTGRSTATPGSADGCQRVRAAFADTVGPQSADEERLLETIEAKLSETVATALASTTETWFTPRVKQVVLTEARNCRWKTQTRGVALDREAEHLTNAARTIERIATRITDADETSLLQLGFEELQSRHEMLASLRQECERLAHDRQALLNDTTSQNAQFGVGHQTFVVAHRTLVDYLYEEFPVDHPVLATIVCLDDVCRDCQRTVRDHLVRRV